MAIATLAVRLTAQIAEFQSEFREATKTAQNFQKEFSTVAGRIGSIAQGIVAGIGVAGVTNFIKNVTDAASKTVDLSNQLGISIGAIQRFSFVAAQTGTTLDTFANSVHRLGINVAGGDKGAVAAIEKLGFAFNELRSLKPEVQFEKLAEALGKVADPQERARLAQELFGRQAKEILPAIAEGYKKLADGAGEAGDAQVLALDRAGDAATRAQARFKNLAVQGFGNIVLGAEEAEKKIFPIADRINEGLQIRPGVLGSIARYNAELKLTADAATAAAAAVQSIKAPPIITQPKIGPAGNLGFDELLKISNDLEKTQEATNKVRKATDEYAASVRQLRDQLSGAALQAEVRKLNDAFNALTVEQRKTPEILQRVGEAAEELRLKGDRLGPTLTIVALETGHFAKEIRTVSDGLPPAIADIGRLGFSIDQLVDPLIASSKAAADMDAELRRLADNAARTGGFFATVPAQAQEVTKQVKTARVEFGELARALSQLAEISGGAFGAVVRGLATVVSAFDVADKSVQQFVKGLKTFTAGGFSNILSGFTGIASGILGIASAAISAGKAIGNLFRDVQHEKVNDLRDVFLLDFGPGGLGPSSGFHTLARQLHELGAAGDQLFQRLINAKKVDEFNAAVEAINAALGKQESRLSSATAVLAEYGLTWEDTGQKFRNANLAAQFEALHEKTLILKEIGVDHNLILEKQASEYSKLLQAALRTGTEIPIAFKPILQDLLTAGKLLREDGTAFDDLGDVTWAKTLTQGFRDVTKAIYDLRDAIVGGVGGALDDLSRRRIQVPIGFDVGEIVLPDLPHLARGGVVRRPTLALVGESGPEAVVPLNQMGTAQAGTSTIIIEADGRQFAEIVVPYIPGVVKRYGLV